MYQTAHIQRLHQFRQAVGAYVRVDGGTYCAHEEVVILAIDGGTAVEMGDGVVVPGAGYEGGGVEGGLVGGGEVEEDLLEDFGGEEHGLGRRVDGCGGLACDGKLIRNSWSNGRRVSLLQCACVHDASTMMLFRKVCEPRCRDIALIVIDKDLILYPIISSQFKQPHRPSLRAAERANDCNGSFHSSYREPSHRPYI